MAETPTPANDQANTTNATISMPYLYGDPRPMDPAVLGKHGLKRGATLNFAAKASALPITIGEFQHALKSFPIVFAGDPPMPIAALGFGQTENLFITSEGKWADDAYVPSYLRRYPFILAEVPGQDRMFLCADVKSDMVTDQSPDMPFFTDGKPTEVVNQALEVCRKFQEDYVLTRSFCAELQKHNLLKPAELRFNAPDGRQQIAGQFITIETQAFEALSDTVFLDFRKRGILPLIYMQQLSQGNWGRLGARKERLAQAK